MNYIVLDMEWNQSYPQHYAFIGNTKRVLTGEIIQIGALKLDEHFQTVDNFSEIVRPTHYSRLHHMVKELTGITKEQISSARKFIDVLPDFLDWCGRDSVFLIWGFDDIEMLWQNIEINVMQDYVKYEFGDIIWHNLQIVYNAEHKDQPLQVSLQAACKKLGIEQDKQLHDALNDAYYTACVCRRLDMKKGLELCENYKRHADESCKTKYRYYDFVTMKEAFEYSIRTDNACPLCHKKMTTDGKVRREYFNQYSLLLQCREHGWFMEKVAMAKIDPKLNASHYKAIKTLYRIREESEEYRNFSLDDEERKSVPRHGRRKYTHRKKKTTDNTGT